MIYLKDPQTGVCVEDATRHEDLKGCIELSADGGDLLVCPDSAEKLLRGLLRWAWKNGRAQIEWVDAEYDAWQNERSR